MSDCNFTECEWRAKGRKLQQRVDELETDAANSKREAESLAMSLWRRHYQDASPDFELCDTTAAVISQIDNMVAGVLQNNENQCAVILHLKAVIRELLPEAGYVVG